MKTVGICAHSSEGGALCFLTACREGIRLLGEHTHPPMVVSALPMGWSMPGWESGDHKEVAAHLIRGVEQLASAGADFFVCPDNTAHIVLEQVVDRLPLPGLHIADVVSDEIVRGGWSQVALLGTEWTMTGPVYERALAERGLTLRIPDTSTRARVHRAIFHELCQGVFEKETTALFLSTIDSLRAEGAECAVLGCTEIPLIVTESNSSLPVIDSTRALARMAVRVALAGGPLPSHGWLR